MTARALLVFLLTASAAFGQSAPLPEGKSDPDALRKLAAMLGPSLEGAGKQPFDPELMKLVEQFMMQGMNAGSSPLPPGLEERIIRDAGQNPRFFEQLKQSNPQLFEQMKQTNPQLVKDIEQKLSERPKTPNPALPKVDGEPPGKVDFPDRPWEQQKNDPRFPNPQNDPTKNPQYQEMAKLLEKTLGPLDKNPAVKQALIDMFSGAANGKPGQKPFWADLDLKNPGNSSNSSGFMKWLQGLSAPNVNAPNMSGNAPKISTGSDWKLPSGPKLPSFDINLGSLGTISVAGLGTAGTAVLIVAVIAVVVFLIWRFFPQVLGLPGRTPKPLPGLGPWTIDPRSIANRADLVKAFEYMSVLVCGDGARVWNHVTIAEALRSAVPDSEPFAEPLAKLYALARYTPMADAFTPEAIAEARGYLCRLAGVQA